MKRITLCLFVASMLTSCRDEHEKKIVTLFELVVNETYLTENSDDWVILHDDNGIIDFRAFEANDHIMFKSERVPEKIGVTFIQVNTIDGRMTGKSYLDQEPMSRWTLRKKSSSVNLGSLVGELNVKVSDANLGSVHNTEISGKLNDLPLSAKSFDTDEVTFGWRRARSQKRYLVFVTDKEGNPMYKFLDEGMTGQHSYSLKDFTAFEKISTISFPSTAIYLFHNSGFENDQQPTPLSGYTANLYLDGFYTKNPVSSLKLGFTNQFTFQWVSGYAQYGNYTLGYEYLGPGHTTNVTLANDITAKVTANSFAEYSVSGSDYDWQRSYWDNSRAPGSWEVYSSNTPGKNLQVMPAEITRKYPNLILDNFAHGSTDFRKGSLTYDNFIAEEFLGLPLQSYEFKFKRITD